MLIVIFFSGLLLGAISIFFYFKTKKESFYKIKFEAQKLLADAKEAAENEKREALANLKRELYKKRSDFDLEIKKEKIEQQRIEHKLQKKEDAIEQREVLLDDLRKELQQKERDMSRRLDALGFDEAKLKKLYNDLVIKLEKVGGMSQDEARKILIEAMEKEVKLEKQKWLSKVDEETNIIAKDKSIEILTSAMQRYLADQVTLHSSSIVNLPNEDMKGRIIGKEGRNIKALEMATGMEFVIGDTPEIITISGFNPIRREVAKRALDKLIQDGRINPTRIEEVVAKCQEEIDQNIEEIGRQAVLEFGFRGVHPELVKLLGSLHFRTSYTQNNLVHSKEVAYFARMVANELGLDPDIAARCGLLHDIGKAVSAEVEGPHAMIGADLAKKYGEDPIVVNAIASHHDEIPAKTIYGLITHIADAISASRPGARRETLTTYIKRLEQLEEIATSFDGVKKAYALQAGREVRVIVDEVTMDDEKAAMLARDIAKKVESELNFPGQIKVNVIREKRIIEFAK
ncbi:ribonuclease Y [Candidatus Dependentiae bacterium]|nr:ribonuclease Y [Candidatus Dependentiae bacterium]MBU4387073.1 ribonuclease Y [Candidatus Dependentiae bacterium]MCG2756225.1 ribonuclease Y [Candidatus Dependentiae bacterium]